MEKIWLSSPHMGSNERIFMDDAFDSNWIAPLGPYVDRFENDLSSVIGNDTYIAALSSGTAAIHLALILLGVKQDDFVICQSFTFSASANPILYQGAIPVFVDSEIHTWNICPELLEAAILQCKSKGKKPKAIICVHLYGNPANMLDIMRIAAKHGIPVIEDAAEALGSTINGKSCGSFGTIGILSFNGNKIITTSGGGALISSNRSLVEKARFLSTQAREPVSHYEHKEIGYNYRLSNIAAAIGCGQLLELKNRVEKRRKNYEIYFNKLSSIEGISFLAEAPGSYSNRWLTTILIDSQNYDLNSASVCMNYLKQFNIESRPLWKPLHLQPVFNVYPKIENGVSESLFNVGLCLPSGSNLSDDQIDQIADLILKFIVK